jgi:hypothetical protein
MKFEHCPICGILIELPEKVTISDGETLEIIYMGSCYLCKKTVSKGLRLQEKL